MSMILDALSRAEKERRAETTSVLDTEKYVPSSTIKDDRFKKWVLIALIANFVLIVFIVIGVVWKTYYKPNNTEQLKAVQENVLPAVVPESQSVSQDESIEPSTQNIQDDVFEDIKNISENTNKTLPATSLIEETKVTTKKVNKKAIAKSVKKIAVKNPPVKYSSKPLSQPPVKAITNESIIAATINSQGSTSSYTKMTDLPVSQRSQLGQYEVNVHVYDDNPQGRFVLINMIKYKEGDLLPGGNTIVSSIVPEGVVIDYGSGKALLERTQ